MNAPAAASGHASLASRAAPRRQAGRDRSVNTPARVLATTTSATAPQPLIPPKSRTATIAGQWNR